MQPQLPYLANIEDETKNNTDYRRVVFTGYMQLVLMCIKPGQEIGLEVHEGHDQFFRIEEGQAKAILDGKESQLQEDDVLIVPSGVEHNIINDGTEDLKLYTIYAPAEHPAGTVQHEKAAA
ncbi:MAG: cupin domain-containing protein [Candidatus Doudnabacteria bacterium]|nr:cupin domain-containing protein [Candidatus Doudnabacteria bacterium]